MESTVEVDAAASAAPASVPETAASAAAAAVVATNSAFRVPTIGESAEGGEAISGVDEIAGSLCMACGGDGTTRMLTTKIPFFREVILSSFECDDCHWRNNEVLQCTSGGLTA